MEIKIVEITDENRPQLLHLAIAGYIGEKCRYCQHVYKSVDDIAARNVVYAGESQYACKVCFDTANPANNRWADVKAAQQSVHPTLLTPCEYCGGLHDKSLGCHESLLL